MISAFGIEHGISKGMKLPGGGRVRFRTKTMTSAVVGGKRVSTDPARQIQARHKGKTIGTMTLEAKGNSLYRKGEVRSLGVNPEHQRKGVATGMWRHAEAQGRPAPVHSHTQTDAGRMFARSVGGPTAKPVPAVLGRERKRTAYGSGGGWN